MIAHIRPPDQERTPSPLARARQMVAETLLPDQIRPSTRWQRWRKPLMVGGAVVAAVTGGLIYYWFR